MAKVAWLGLGVMGAPMARNIRSRGGHDVTVFNRTAAKAAQWVAANKGCVSAPTPAEAARPMRRPVRPAITAARSGSSGIAMSRLRVIAGQPFRVSRSSTLMLCR